MSTFQEILDDILIKTGNKGVAQNFPVSERTELINEEYIFDLQNQLLLSEVHFLNFHPVNLLLL